MRGQLKLVLLCAALALSAYAQSYNDGNVHLLKVQGNVYMLVGAGGNIAAQVGKDGIFLVNSGNGKMNDKVLAALKTLSDKPIHYIINTSSDPELTGGNEVLARTGAPVMGGNLGQSNHGAAIVASENVLNRMSAPSGQKAPSPDSLPGVVFFEGDKEIFFNGEPVITMLAPAAHTDGDTIVFFRRSDVISTGEIFNTVSYPIIDLEAGGSINGVIDGLNHVLDIAVPEHEQEGGTYIIPGHGRLCDEHDVLEYRDMVTIVRDRVQTAIKRGMTLEQVKAAGYTKEYDPRWGAKTGPGTTDMFIEAVYKSLKK
jgi:glyoxylase-like metal-dependent hydrolase (beta-lactamase superfamily II)